jgi:hypothetical protein
MARKKILGIGAAIALLGALAVALILLADNHHPAQGNLASPASAQHDLSISRAPDTAKRQPPTGPPADLLRSGARASFGELAGSLPARIGIAIGPLGSGGIKTLGLLQDGHAWSSIKVPILVTLMREGQLNAQEEQWASKALTESDNSAASTLFQQLERTHGGLAGASAAVQEVLSTAGDTSTIVATEPPPPGAVSTYGQTDWSLTGSVWFYRELAAGCLLDRKSTGYVLRLMGEVIPEQRWGIGKAGFPEHWQVGMKGGWGPENGTGRYLVRQAGIVQDGNSGLAVAIIAEDDSGSYEAGAQDLTRIAIWLREHLRFPLPPINHCGD